MTSAVRTRATILAHHLYDFADCEHRVALDATLDRSRRTPPDAAMELLYEHGRRFEREVVEPLGYPSVEVVDGAWDDAFARTLELMRSGVHGIDQAVLIDGARLARPDLVERVPGPSRFGAFHYRPGDVKSARSTRSDAVLQVGFAALLLETVQGRRPETGFLVLGDGKREDIDLEAIRCTVDDAVERAESVAAGAVATSPFFSSSCARCRWRGECLPQLEQAHDLSFVHGVTRARRRVLRGYGIATIDDLARADCAVLVAAGVPADGLDRMQAQARALLEGRALRTRDVALPRGRRRELYLRIETDPLDRGEPFLIAWAEGPAGGGALEAERVAIVSSAKERSEALMDLVATFESPAAREEPVFVYGAATAHAFDTLGESAGLVPARAGDLAGRFVDLAPWIRRAGVFPVFLYRFDELAAVARGLPRPSPGLPEDALFVAHAGLASRDDGRTCVEALERAGHDAVQSLRAIRARLEQHDSIGSAS